MDTNVVKETKDVKEVEFVEDAGRILRRKYMLILFFFHYYTKRPCDV